MKRLCQAADVAEYHTPDGGTLAYGSCKKHGYFMAMIHCSTADVRNLAKALLEAADHAEAKKH